MKTPGFSSPKNPLRCACGLAAMLLIGSALPARTRSRADELARLVVDTGRAGCTVELDSTMIGKTGAEGHLSIDDVDPGDHYVHVQCPGDKQGTAYFISPGPGGAAKVEPNAALAGPKAPAAADPGLETVEARMRLRQLVQQAVQMRAHGRIEEAVRALHEAARLDPENSDLHRELGITFLLDKDWKRARVEMIEAIRHDPGDADAHNGLGYALEKLGQTEAALAEYRTATHLDPDDPTYREHYIGALGRLAAEKAALKKK